MKGTLYSADFILTSDDDLKLLELNTDTSFTDTALNSFNFDDFTNVLVSNGISNVHVVNKEFQNSFYLALSSSLQSNTSYSGSIEQTVEEAYTIYPTDVDDDSTTFVLRCAYNESAVFDSLFCANELELYQLMQAGHTGSKSEDIPGYYISSSEESVDINKIETSLNSGSNIPDFIIKNTAVHGDGRSEYTGFYKVGHSSGSDADRVNDFVDSRGIDGHMIVNYYRTDNSTNSVKSIRSANIIYGDDLTNVNLYAKLTDSFLELPTVTELDSEIDDTQLYYKYPTKHYFQFATNVPKVAVQNQDGILGEELLKSGSLNVAVSDAVEGNVYQSIRVDSLPDTDDKATLMSWSYDGQMTFETSDVTASVLVSSTENNLEYNAINEVLLESGSWSGSLYAGPALPILVYDVDEDKTMYKEFYDLKSSDKVYKEDGLVNISGRNYVVLDNEDASTYTLNFEENDVFTISEAQVSIISHNINYSGCFAEGTPIRLADDTFKAINEIEVGDEVLSWDESTGEYSPKAVTAVHTHDLIDSLEVFQSLGHTGVGLYQINGEGAYFTPNHPIWVIGGQGWSAIHPDKSEDVWSGSEDGEDAKGQPILKVGDTVLIQGEPVEITSLDFTEKGDSTKTYNISVADFQTYEADGLLVHNK